MRSRARALSLRPDETPARGSPRGVKDHFRSARSPLETSGFVCNLHESVIWDQWEKLLTFPGGTTAFRGFARGLKVAFRTIWAVEFGGDRRAAGGPFASLKIVLFLHGCLIAAFGAGPWRRGASRCGQCCIVGVPTQLTVGCRWPGKRSCWRECRCENAVQQAWCTQGAVCMQCWKSHCSISRNSISAIVSALKSGGPLLTSEGRGWRRTLTKRARRGVWQRTLLYAGTSAGPVPPARSCEASVTVVIL